MYNHCKKIGSLLLMLLLAACGKETPIPDNPLPGNTSAQGVLILCEGNYGLANGRIDYYDKEKEELFSNVFSTRNNRPLGDVVQSALLLNERLYVVVNNSGKIEMMNPDNFTSTGTATGFMSPRYILPLSSGSAYVSDLYAGKLNVVQLPGLEISGSISLPGWTEEMILAGDKAFVCNYERNYVYVIDTHTNNVSDSIATGSTPGSIARDKNGKLWALCGGNLGQTSVSSLVQIDPGNHTVLQTINPDAEAAFKLRMDKNGERMYFLGSSKIYSMGIDETQPQVFFGESGHNWYGLRIDPQSGYIWAADALSYNQEGKVYILKSDGSLYKSFSTGVIPTDFLFY